VLLRHGRTGDNADGRIQGQLDTPLDEVGREQAAAVAPFLAAARPAVLLSSDLQRARATAAPLAVAAGLPVRTDPRLRELDLGAWQGLTGAQARERFPEEHAAWRRGLDVPRGGGETYAQAGARAVECLLGALPDVPDGGTLVAVTHGGTARGALCALLELPSPQWWRLGALGNTCWTVLVEHERGWRLEQHGGGPQALAEPARWAPQGEPVRY
jgi:broad specificity phosphatase PhoE